MPLLHDRDSGAIRIGIRAQRAARRQGGVVVARPVQLVEVAVVAATVVGRVGERESARK